MRYIKFGLFSVLMALLVLFGGVVACATTEMRRPAEKKEGDRSAEPAKSSVLAPAAPGFARKENMNAEIDYSNAADGYVMVRWKGRNESRVKVVIRTPTGVSYQYDLRLDGTYETFPLSEGSGDYTVNVYRNITEKQYISILDAEVEAELTDEFAPFLRPNQYVNYSADSRAVQQAAELCTGLSDNLAKIDRIYGYIIASTTYDAEKARSVRSGYLPDVDETLRTGRGICFDYTALMAAMLRSQGVPTKLIIGYTGELYHSWLAVWSEEEGWIRLKVHFRRDEWNRMDPTFASQWNSDREIMDYIEKDANYTALYTY